MKIVVGLGNIGDKYVRNRHNCGFIFLDTLVEELEAQEIPVKWREEAKFKAIIAKINYRNEKVLLVKPTTLMNISGEAVAKILNFYKEIPSNLIVISDDIDLPLGIIRIREKGSAGTHNGLKSVIQSINTENFTRIRIGIEHRGSSAEKQDLSSFVLSDFTKEEIPLLKEAIDQAVFELKKLLPE